MQALDWKNICLKALILGVVVVVGSLVTRFLSLMVANDLLNPNGDNNLIFYLLITGIFNSIVVLVACFIIYRSNVNFLKKSIFVSLFFLTTSTILLYLIWNTPFLGTARYFITFICSFIGLLLSEMMN